MESFGAWSLLPTLVVLVMAIITRRTIESLMAGALGGEILLGGGNIHCIIQRQPRA